MLYGTPCLLLPAGPRVYMCAGLKGLAVLKGLKGLKGLKMSLQQV